MKSQHVSAVGQMAMEMVSRYKVVGEEERDDGEFSSDDGDVFDSFVPKVGGDGDHGSCTGSF